MSFTNNLSCIHYFIFYLINNYTEVECKPQILHIVLKIIEYNRYYLDMYLTTIIILFLTIRNYYTK